MFCMCCFAVCTWTGMGLPFAVCTLHSTCDVHSSDFRKFLLPVNHYFRKDDAIEIQINWFTNNDAFYTWKTTANSKIWKTIFCRFASCRLLVNPQKFWTFFLLAIFLRSQVYLKREIENKISDKLDRRTKWHVAAEERNEGNKRTTHH